MAGSFGLEKETAALSESIGRRLFLPKISEPFVVSGFSCFLQAKRFRKKAFLLPEFLFTLFKEKADGEKD